MSESETQNQMRNAGVPIQNLTALESILDEHTRGDHERAPHPDCGACRAAKMLNRGEMPWEDK